LFRTALYCCLALLAFAANSLLCRLALASGSIDAASFTFIRLAAGTVILAILVRARPTLAGPDRHSWSAAILLFLYALPFSFAYRQLHAGTGALLLFGAVQVTMFLGSLHAGRQPAPGQWLGLLLAFGGLTYLVSPGLAAPPPLGAGLMLLAGFAWGLYSLHGRAARDPLGRTASNFTRALLLSLLGSLALLPQQHLELRGFGLAVASGALASGLGYVLWYKALPELSPATAAIIQLAVPILTGVGGVAFLEERLTWRLGIAGLLVLGGIGLALLPSARPSGSLTTE
jgi:drug/metabolite transporter (DMT)-like permease